MEALHDVAQHEEARIVRRRRVRIRSRRGVADQRGIVAAAPQLVRQVGEAVRQRNGVLNGAVVHQVLAGQQAGPRRAARHTLREVVAERHALGTQPVQIGQFQIVRAELGQHQAPPLVNHDHQDVLGSWHAFPHWRSSLGRPS